MCPTLCQMDAECELSLDDIHQSVEFMLTNIREKHEQVDAIFGDLPHLKRTVENILEPLNKKVGLEEVATQEHLKALLSRCIRSSPPNSGGRKNRLPTPPTKLRPLPRALSDGGIEKGEPKGVALPPLKPKSLSASHTRHGTRDIDNEIVLLPIKVHKTLQTTLHTVTPTKNGATLTQKPLGNTARRQRLLKRQKNETRDENEPTDIKHFEMSRFVDDFEREICVLQQTFSSFTQRVLVPLQTFCKHCNNTDVPTKKERPNEEITPKSVHQESLDKTEFRIVQTMNQIRQLLWPSDKNSVPTHLFCEDHFSQKVSEEVDCVKFPVIRVIPDVLQKFNGVLSLASIWLKRDVMHVQSAKSALQRAHRRFLKTERLWRQARDSQRQLKRDWETILGELQSNESRLNAVNNDINNLKLDMERSRKAKKIIEDKLQNTSESVELLVTKHRAVRKKVIVLSTKIEARERSHGFLHSRVLSLKADQEAANEKLRISDDYTNNLQNKMEELYGLRDAWSRRYEEKTDPEKLKARLQLTRIRMPLPSLREKTFILRTGMENLRRALDLVEKRLSANEIHWSKLCNELPWPDSKEITPPPFLPMINNHEHGLLTSAKRRKEINSNQKSTSHVSKIRDRVVSAHPEDEKGQRTLMLQLWLEENGKDATVEKLLEALRASSVPSIADSVERHIT